MLGIPAGDTHLHTELSLSVTMFGSMHRLVLRILTLCACLLNPALIAAQTHESIDYNTARFDRKLPEGART